MCLLTELIRGYSLSQYGHGLMSRRLPCTNVLQCRCRVLRSEKGFPPQPMHFQMPSSHLINLSHLSLSVSSSSWGSSIIAALSSVRAWPRSRDLGVDLMIGPCGKGRATPCSGTTGAFIPSLPWPSLDLSSFLGGVLRVGTSRVSMLQAAALSPVSVILIFFGCLASTSSFALELRILPSGCRVEVPDPAPVDLVSVEDLHWPPSAASLEAPSLLLSCLPQYRRIPHLTNLAGQEGIRESFHRPDEGPRMKQLQCR
ncbi:hypothetical protein F5148DRAFT_317551 [Russula earlei]|uniref:Uncharacterized protein n=1 Tax=Russula earlei TaxID=71964 RepID=A0ACC0U1Y7_9AGAM|nr:hypothetical protein F5148DRAFT_317551 [Russula earlei]